MGLGDRGRSMFSRHNRVGGSADTTPPRASGEAAAAFEFFFPEDSTRDSTSRDVITRTLAGYSTKNEKLEYIENLTKTDPNSSTHLTDHEAEYLRSQVDPEGNRLGPSRDANDQYLDALKHEQHRRAAGIEDKNVPTTDEQAAAWEGRSEEEKANMAVLGDDDLQALIDNAESQDDIQATPKIVAQRVAEYETSRAESDTVATVEDGLPADQEQVDVGHLQQQQTATQEAINMYFTGTPGTGTSALANRLSRLDAGQLDAVATMVAAGAPMTAAQLQAIENTDFFASASTSSSSSSDTPSTPPPAEGTVPSDDNNLASTDAAQQSITGEAQAGPEDDTLAKKAALESKFQQNLLKSWSTLGQIGQPELYSDPYSRVDQFTSFYTDASGAQVSRDVKGEEFYQPQDKFNLLASKPPEELAGIQKDLWLNGFYGTGTEAQKARDQFGLLTPATIAAMDLALQAANVNGYVDNNVGAPDVWDMLRSGAEMVQDQRRGIPLGMNMSGYHKTYDDMKTWASLNGVEVTEDQLHGIARKSTLGVREIEASKQKLRNQQAFQYSAYADELRGGYDLYEISSNYRQLAGQYLGLDPNSVDLSEPHVQEAISAEKPVPLWEYKNKLRQDERYQYTDKAYEEVGSAMDGLMRIMGQ